MKRHPGRGLGVERGTLAHPEAMLLVDHAERELTKLHRRLDQRVRAHHELQLPRREPAEDLAAARRGSGPGEQGDGDESAEQAVERGQVLLGQRLGGRHEGSLRTVLDGAEHRAQGHNGLAGAHLSHQQALHRLGAGEVRVDLLEGLPLVVRGLERERRSPGVHQLAGRLELRRRAALLARAPPARERQLEQQQLLEREPAARLVLVLLVPLAREVKRRERRRATRQPLGRPDVGGQWLDHVVHAIALRRHEFANPIRSETLRAGIHGHHAYGVHGAAHGLHRLVRGHPELVALLHPAPKQEARAGRHPIRHPRLVEPHRQHRPRLVRHPRLGPWAHAAVARWPGGDRLDLHLHRPVLVDRESGDRAHVAAVGVAAREVLEQIADGLEPEPGRALARLLPEREALLQAARARQRVQRHGERLLERQLGGVGEAGGYDREATRDLSRTQVTRRPGGTTRRAGRPAASRAPRRRAARPQRRRPRVARPRPRCR